MAGRMLLMIPTYKRVGKQETYNRLPASMRSRTLIMCPREEMEAHADAGIPREILVAQPDDIKTISAKRAYMFRLASAAGVEKVFMLDDDLSIEGRTPDGRLLREGAPPERIEAEFDKMEAWLDEPDIAQVGISHRPQNIHVEGPYAEIGRCMYAFGLHIPTAMEVIEWGRVTRREDMDYTLQLLLAGYKNRITYEICVSDRGYDNDAGGCTDERSLEEGNREAEKLAALYPGLVRVVDRGYTSSAPRKEVVVAWQKAYKADALPLDLFHDN